LEEEAKGSDLTFGQLNGFYKKVNETYSNEAKDKIQKLITHGKYHLKNFPPLNLIEIEYVFVQTGQSRSALKKSQNLCLELLLQVIVKPDVDPYEFIGGDLTDLDFSHEWEKCKEIFLDKNLLMDGPSDLNDLDLTHDVAEWYDDVNQNVELQGFPGYSPLPCQRSFADEFMSSLALENTIEIEIETEQTKSDLPF
jgi:hypothetical protein